VESLPAHLKVKSPSRQATEDGGVRMGSLLASRDAERGNSQSLWNHVESLHDELLSASDVDKVLCRSEAVVTDFDLRLQDGHHVR